MELCVQRRKDTGAFYTPKAWADKAVQYLARTLPEPLHYYVWYDPAGGEGALLEALPPECVRFGSTLEAEDVEIMRNKGIDAMQFDFLDGDLSQLPKMLHYAANMGRLIVFTNPPYFKLKASHLCFAKTEYGSNDSVLLFFYRIYRELMPQYLASFNKLDILMPGGKMIEAVNEIVTSSRCLGGFTSPSKTWGLSGEFSIAFNMFELTDMEGYYGRISTGISKEYEWELDIYNAYYERLPYKKPSVRAICLHDMRLSDFNEDGSCKDADLEARMKLCEAHAEKNRNNPVRGRINEWIKPLRPLKENKKVEVKQKVVQLAFDF